MINKEIKVVILCNCQPELKDTKQIKLLNEFVPRPPSCGIETLTICSTDFTEQIVNEIDTFNPDIICHYGLELGMWFSEISDTTTIKDKIIPIIVDNHSVNELFYTEKYMYSTLFDIIKKKITDIDLVKSRPEKLFVAKTEEDLIYLRDRCFKEPFGFDTETNFLNPFIKTPKPKLLCYSLAWLSDEDEGWCIPTSDALIKSGKCTFTKETALKYSEEIFFDSNQAMFIHNAAYDLLVLHELFNGRQPKNFTADTMVLLNLYHHANKSAALKENTHLINLPAYKDPIKDWLEEQTKILSKAKKEAKGKDKEKIEKKTYGYEDVPLDIIAPYAAMDALAVVRLINFLKKNMARSLWSFYYKIPHKVIQTANELACEGYVFSRDRFLYSKLEFETQILEAYNSGLKMIDKYIDNHETFNIASSEQIGDILFNENKLNLPIFHKTKLTKKPSTDQKALDDLILFHPFIFKLSKLKKLLKLYSTYSYRGYSGALNEGSRQYKKTGNWTINSQYKQTNRTARLGSTNFTGHNDVKKKGGPILTLPAHGSMVKHYFVPGIVAEAENVLYNKILEKLSEEDKQKVLTSETFDVSLKIKPDKTPKKRKAINDNNDTSEEE